MSCDDTHLHQSQNNRAKNMQDNVSNIDVCPISERQNDPSESGVLEADLGQLAVGGRTTRGQFAPGQSGNRRGRPRKKPEAIDDMFSRVLSENVSMTQDGKTVVMPFAEAIFRGMCYKGIRDPRVGRDIFKLAMSRLLAVVQSEMDEQIARGQEILDNHLARARRRLVAELLDASEQGTSACDNDNTLSETSAEGECGS